MYSNFCRRRSIRLLLPLLVAVAVLLIAPVHGLAQNPPPQGGGEAHLILPDLSQATFVGINGRTLLMAGLGICALGLLFGLFTYNAVARSPCPPIDARRIGTDLGDLQNLSLDAGQVPADSRDFHRRHHPVLLRLFRAPRTDQGNRDSAVQRSRDRGQLRRGLVRHPRQYVRQFAHGVRQPARQAVIPVIRFPCAPA